MSPSLCATCKKHPVEPKFRPFCSKRCADLDLQRWLSDAYAIPAVEDDQDPGRSPPEEED
jgi:endogenous inhibitor of DNA gyrase (YacG/DUF329 family)